MKNKLMVANLMVLVGICALFFSTRVTGTCSTGINKDHLDHNAGAFVDGTTIEIAANGLQVKALPGNCVQPAKIDSIFGSWADRDSSTNLLVKDAIYKVTSDGILLAQATNPSGSINYWMKITIADNAALTVNNFDITVHQNSSSGLWQITTPIKKNQYYKLTLANASVTVNYIRWLPVGTGQCEKQP